jgi:methionine sulfoxide reductase heme-binding subunit
LLIAATLLIGPWNLLCSRPGPISSDLRRDTGIWAGAITVLHALIGQFVHLRGRPWLYYIYGPDQHHAFPVRHDLFGSANYTGLAGLLVVALLLATSNDYSLRALGTPQWKRLQRWNYAAFALTAVHAVAYLIIEKQELAWDVIVVSSLACVAVFQTTGYIIRRGRAKLPSRVVVSRE